MTYFVNIQIADDPAPSAPVNDFSVPAIAILYWRRLSLNCIQLSGIVYPMCVANNVPFPLYNKIIRCKPYLDSAGYFQSSDQYKLPSYRCLESNSMYPKSEPQAHCPTQTCSQSFLVNGSMIKQLSLFAGGCLCIKYYFSVSTLFVTLSSFWLLGI